MSSLISKLTVTAIALTCKTFLNIGYCSSVTVNGLENLVEALKGEERDHGRGIITMSNHISTLDDPVVWGILPTRYYLNTRTTRWVLGASDIMFTNPVLSIFFRNGQVIETLRGGGIYQKAVDDAINKLNEGAWVHLFGEGKVNQLSNDPQGEAKLLRFKWGVGRIVMETKKPPLIIPMWLTGFNDLMPEGRPSPYNFFPRSGADLSVTFGKPVCSNDIKAALALSPVVQNQQGDQPLGKVEQPQVFSQAAEEKGGVTAEEGWLGDTISPLMQSSAKGEQARSFVAKETERIRSAITATLQRNVEALGKDVIAKARKLS